MAAAAAPSRRKLVVSAIEHPAVLNTARALAQRGLRRSRVVPVDGAGRLDLEALREQVDGTTALVSVMLANNETGVLQPVAEAAALAHAAGALVHCDAVQAAGKVAVDVTALRCDLLTLSAHKLYGPQGVGALYVRRGTSMQALLRGGSQERNRRAGTENVLGAVGFGRAAELARAELVSEGGATGLAARPPGGPPSLHCGGAGERRGGPRAEHHQRVLHGSGRGGPAHGPGPRGDRGVHGGGLCGGRGRALSCARGHGPRPPERIRGSLRFSLGRGTSEDEVDRAAAAVAAAVRGQKS